ncbi:MAG: divergent polysaccharide deacetylase family protein, partial [Alphaproteobacteria bacterium]|nr:divergent polysaccharide deacetylase family protein [Alphaproteobacteria bacterium]
IPYAPRLGEQARVARDAGHELLLHMPMEPVGSADPGQGALLVDLSPDEIRQRFQEALASFVGFDGVNNHMGSKFTTYKPGMEIVIDELSQRHLFFLDSRTTAQSIGVQVAAEHHLPHLSRDVFLDDDMNPKSIRQQLAQVEKIARSRGHVIAIGHPHDVTLQALEEWIPEAIKRGFVFVPLHNQLALNP